MLAEELLIPLRVQKGERRATRGLDEDAMLVEEVRARGEGLLIGDGARRRRLLL